MRRNISIKRLDQLVEVVRGMTAEQGFAKVWSALCDRVEDLWGKSVFTGDDASLHSLTLKPKTGDAATDVVIAGADTTTPTSPNFWQVTREGRATFKSLKGQGVTPAFTQDENGHFYTSQDVNVGMKYLVTGTQVVGPRLAAITPATGTATAPSGGTTVDAESRTAISQLITDCAALRTELAAHRNRFTTHGLTS